MSWEELSTPPKTGTCSKAPIEFCIAKFPGGKILVAKIVVRASRFESPSWLVAGKPVRVLRGTGEDVGTICILPGGSIMISRSGGPNGSAAMIRLSLWPGLPSVLQRSPVSFRLREGGIDIDLPAWAVREAPKNAGAAPLPAVKSAMIGKPAEHTPGAYSMLGGKVPAAGRAS